MVKCCVYFFSCKNDVFFLHPEHTQSIKHTSGFDWTFSSYHGLRYEHRFYKRLPPSMSYLVAGEIFHSVSEKFRPCWWHWRKQWQSQEDLEKFMAICWLVYHISLAVFIIHKHVNRKSWMPYWQHFEPLIWHFCFFLEPEKKVFFCLSSPVAPLSDSWCQAAEMDSDLVQVQVILSAALGKCVLE